MSEHHERISDLDDDDPPLSSPYHDETLNETIFGTSETVRYRQGEPDRLAEEAGDRLIELFMDVDARGLAEAITELLQIGDVQAFYRELGITQDEAEEILRNLGSRR